jgi:hypothetical protein
VAERIKLVQGDTGPQLKLTLTDQNTGEPTILTGATVTLRLRATGGTTILVTRAGLLNVDTALLGQVVFTWATGDLDLPAGSYEGEVEVVFPDGMRQTVYEVLKFSIREDFA